MMGACTLVKLSTHMVPQQQVQPCVSMVCGVHFEKNNVLCNQYYDTIHGAVHVE